MTSTTVAAVENDKAADAASRESAATVMTGEDGQPLVPDCAIPNLTYDNSPLDEFLLSLFRNLVTKQMRGRGERGSLYGTYIQSIMYYYFLYISEGAALKCCAYVMFNSCSFEKSSAYIAAIFSLLNR